LNRPIQRCCGSIAQLGSGDVWTAGTDYDGASDLLQVRANITGVLPATALMSPTLDLVSVLSPDAVRSRPLPVQCLRAIIGPAT
jgi:hypothetical protein